MKLALMHGSDWSGQDVAAWWLSEKLDGWRALWTGTEFLTRNGTSYDAPAWFCAGMPDTPLDGELWAGPGTTHDHVNRAVRAGDWSTLTFRPFDIPTPGLITEAAQAILRELPLPAHVQPVEYRRVTSTPEAIAVLHRTVMAGGEGVMLRRPGSKYCAQHRTTALLKMKPGTSAPIGAMFAPAQREAKTRKRTEAGL